MAAAEYMRKITLAYLRLSLADDGEKDESNSISSQRKCILDYCRKNGIGQNYEECVDDGYSGTNFQRPGFQKLLQMVRTGNVSMVLVKDLSRLGRNYLEAGYYLEYLFPYYKVRVIAVNDNYDSKESGESAIGLEAAVRNLMNDCYSRDISKKISSAVHIKKISGEYVYGTAPFGYKKGKSRNTIIVDGEAAEIVRRIFHLAADGTTVSRIARLLNEEKVITPSKYLAPIRPNYKVSEFWSYESVRNILINRIYTGDTETYKSHVVKIGSDRVKQIPDKERVVIQNTHEALVSRELYEKARSVIKSNVKGPKKKAGSVLTGFLYCGCCGGRLSKGKESNKRFLCVNARYRPDSGCSRVRPEESRLKEVLLKAVSLQIELLHERERELHKLINRERSEILQIQREQSKVSSQRKKLMDEKLRLYEEYAGGKMDKEEYLSEKMKTEACDKKLKEQEKVLSDRLNEMQNERNRIAEQERPDFARIQTDQGISKELLDSLVSRVVVSPGDEVDIYWKFKDEINK